MGATADNAASSLRSGRPIPRRATLQTFGERIMKVFKLILKALGITFLMMIFWHTLIPSAISGLAFKGRYPRVVSPIGAAIIVLISYQAKGDFYPGITSVYVSPAYGIIQALGAWVFCTILFYWGYRVSEAAKDGWNSTDSCVTE